MSFEELIEDKKRQMENSFFEYGKLIIYKYLNKVITDPNMNDFLADLASARIIQDIEVNAQARAIAIVFGAEGDT